MFELTHKHLELITADVSKADISFSHLKYDLIDHICCDLEYEINQGLPFEKAYEKVKKRIGIRGLQQIQEDTLSLIDKKYRMMKNTMKTFGVIAPILMAIGSLFKIEHWTGAGIMLTLGFFLLCFVFLPSAVYVSYREVSNRKKLFTHITGFLAGFLFAVGFLFKIQHWPGAGLLILTASVITGLGFIPAFFINHIKESSGKQKSAYILGFMGSFIYLAGFLFKINHWPGAYISMFVGTVLLIIIAFPLLIVSHYKNYEHVSSRFIFLCFAIVWFIVPTALISLNISIDVLKGFKTNVSEKEYQIQYLTTKNQNLMALMEGSSSEMIDVKKQSDELVMYIQNIKNKILSLAAGKPVNSDTVNYDEIDISDTNLAEQVLLKKEMAKELQDKMNTYRLFLLQRSAKDSISTKLVTEILIPVYNTEKDWKHVTLIYCLNKLSGFQENILKAEEIVFRSMKSKTTMNQAMAASRQ